MSFSVNFQSRDFSTIILTGLQADPVRISWTAYGGPDDALLHLFGEPHKLIDAAGLLRAPVTISDPYGVSAWWGFVDKVTIHLEGTRFSISLDELFNRVKVAYSFTSPDHQLAEQLETAFADSIISQEEYGIKEKVLYYTNIDDDFATAARDTFLETHAFPKSGLDTRIKTGQVFATLHCSGWFKTFGWKSYSYDDGFYSNYGPGPGVLKFSAPSYVITAQSFQPGAAGSVKYIYFRLNREGSPAENPYARIYSNSGNAPNAVLATSGAVDRTTIPTVGYSWIRFTFATAYALSASTRYWAAVRSNGSDGSNYFQIRTDEANENAQNFKKAMYHTGAAWANVPNISAPGNLASLYYRVVCISDTGTHLANIASEGDQFFNHIWNFTTGVTACPYVQEDITCLEQLLKIMQLGTSNDRLILTSVSEERNLTFYEQPSADTPTAYLSKSGKFYTNKGVQLAAYRPPVGQFAILANTPRLAMPFDKIRTPTCFVRNAIYYPAKDQLSING